MPRTGNKTRADRGLEPWPWRDHLTANERLELDLHEGDLNRAVIVATTARAFINRIKVRCIYRAKRAAP